MDVSQRLQWLSDELSKEQKNALLSARFNYAFAYVAVIASVALSAIAGVGGLFFKLSPEVVGGFAILPGLVTLLVTSLKPQAKANLHYRRHDAYKALTRDIKIGVSETPTIDDVKALLTRTGQFESNISELWEQSAAVELPSFPPPRDAAKPKPPAGGGTN